MWIVNAIHIQRACMQEHQCTTEELAAARAQAAQQQHRRITEQANLQQQVLPFAFNLMSTMLMQV